MNRFFSERKKERIYYLVLLSPMLPLIERLCLLPVKNNHSRGPNACPRLPLPLEARVNSQILHPPPTHNAYVRNSN
jgi:hypothetical protein